MGDTLRCSVVAPLLRPREWAAPCGSLGLVPVSDLVVESWMDWAPPDSSMGGVQALRGHWDGQEDCFLRGLLAGCAPLDDAG
jgi:hypothetical protein